MAGLLDDPSGYVGGLLGEAWKRFRGVDPQTGQPDYWNRGGVAGLLGMPSWDQQSPTDIAMGFAGATTPALKGVAGALAKPQGIRAYHGSPHDFDRFDLSKIGTGEGAQAYGHGLYFAENEGVARGYRDALAKDAYYSSKGEMFDPQSHLQHLNVRVAARNNGPDLDATIARAQELLPKASSQTRPMIEHDLAVLHRLKDDGGISKNPGRMYEVQINADPERFLDWEGQMPKIGRHSGDYETVAAALGRAYRNEMHAGDLLGVDRATPADLSRGLADQGIPGIKYLDQGSRGAANVNDLRGTVSMWERAAKKTPDDPYAKQMLDQARSELAQAEGGLSRNYVVFDDKLIDILRKYGLLGPMAGGATAGAVGDY